ncbi:MAG: hypothetical protein B6I20_03320 [Bacteroidetes bacterium 4572_117]|nr:MAG: hypothetical protein B6I20_03320 [Bacteroidetes bacterium 4572_117]
MNAQIIEPTIQTPYICFDPHNNKFEISGKSLPEDADEFYKPLIKWLENYKKNPNKETNFNIKLDYYNTSSARYINTIIKVLANLSLTHKVKIFWYYREIDEDMQLMGEGYSESTGVDFELVEI